ncbi:MAG: 4-(cytidine 5'-diphospho)-2-C-methyl-D-erythritol kinase [Fimbriimonadaceae bacterium]|nr:4-(cytidine 5'-diphospho)-2-C-methyl-D-erythritol kinase [Fimbriimonadaceae bacterium]
MLQLTVRCPAKINTFLAVGPRDDRGYHPLRTVFQTISLTDTLTLSASDSFAITSDWAGLPTENTLSKVARFLSEISDLPKVQVHLEKRIPSESGLGGGSSDAAGLIRGLQRIAPGKWEDHFLRDTAKAVGMDVPFFLYGGRALAEGYGDQITPLPDLAKEWIVVVRPPVGVSTVSGYKALDELAYPFREWPNDANETYNDFERVAPRACDEAIDRLRDHGAIRAGLSGSGSAVFGFFADEDSARNAYAPLTREDVGEAWVCHTLTREESLWTS